MPVISLTASAFKPSTSLSGNDTISVYRGENIVLRGVDSSPRFECYRGSKNLGENYNIASETLTGTLSFTANSSTITGSGTQFMTELHTGQKILAGSEPLVVNRIVSNTSFIADRPATTTATGQTARYMLVISELDKTRLVMRRGNAIKIDKGDILFTGDGVMYRNGVSTTFTATRQPKRLQYNTDGTYTEKPFGFENAPPVPVIAATTGGTKGMMAGKYSFMISYYNSVTRGFSNPSDVIKKDAGATDLTITAGGRFEFDFTTSLVGMPSNADGFLIWQNLSGGGVTDVNASTFANGGWFKAGIVLVADLAAGDKAFHECLDTELGFAASGDNDRPPECEWLAEFANTVFFISALGKKTSTNALGTSPGNYVIPAKGSNKEGAPTDWGVSVSDEINGFALGLGRLFCLTATGIPFVTPTGKPELAKLVPTFLDSPFTSRPFWTKGGISPYNIEVVQGDVYVYTGKKLLMSPRGADEKSDPFELSKDIQDLTKNWSGGYVFLKHDPQNQQLCVISSATKKNDAGYWISEILPFDLERKIWLPVIKLSSDTRDMIVSGAAIVNDRLEFLAGGRVSGGSFSISTFRYDELPDSPEAVSWYLAATPTDNGAENVSKKINWFRVTGKVTSPVIQVHGADWGGAVSTEDIENGTNSLSGNISLPTTTEIVREFKKKHLVKNLQIYSVRLSGTWSGSGDVDRIDELVIDVSTHGISQ